MPQVVRFLRANLGHPVLAETFKRLQRLLDDASIFQPPDHLRPRDWRTRQFLELPIRRFVALDLTVPRRSE
jgi:hypothetical protein